jgi:putative glutathione S-transferase
LATYFANEVEVRPRGRETVSEQDEQGAFVRQPNYFTKPITDKDAEKDKYIIYWSPICNWSNRPVIARDILGLQNVIRDYKVGHAGERNIYGWGFPNEPDFRDPNTGVYFLSQLYKNADPNYTGRATTPTFADISEKKAVSSDYHRLTNYIEVAFRKFQPVDAPDLYPVKYRKEIDEFNDWLFPHVNNGHYRQAFTNVPEIYDESQEDFHAALEKLDARLSDNRFLFGDYITDSDIRAYVTLIKWETDFYVFVGPQKKRISAYENIWAYVKELYNIPEFKRYTNLPKKKDKPDNRPNYLEKIASRDFDKWLATDGSRKKLSSDPEHIYLRHPEGETADDYQTEISQSQWNSKEQAVRANWHFELSINAAVNPLKGLMKND